MSFQAPITIAQAIQRVETNRYLLPALQREFVWKSEKVEWLFDSLVRNYPIGSFLFWRVEGESKSHFKFYKILTAYRQYFKTHNDEINTNGLPDFEAVLDGQQRLTSLFIGLKGSYAYHMPRKWRADDEYSIPTRYLYLNIVAPLEDEEDQRIYNFSFLTKEEVKKDGGSKKWFTVGDILNLSDNFEFNKFLDKNNYKENEFTYKTLSTLHSVIHTRPLINFFLETEQDYDKALNIFIRVNSGGEPLSFSDLLMSIIVTQWNKIDAKKEFNDLIDSVRDLGFNINSDFVIKSLLVLFCPDVKFKVTNLKHNIVSTFEKNWDSIKESVYTSFKLLKGYGYDSRSLTSANAVIPIIHYLFHRNIFRDFDKKIQFKEDRQIIKKWLHIVLLKQIFGRAADSVLKDMRDTIAEAIKASTNMFPVKKITDNLKGTGKDVVVDDDFIESLLTTQKENAYAFPILALLYPSLDYRNNDFHKDHCHPADSFKTNQLEKAGIKDGQLAFYEDKKNWNSILNLQMLDSNENKSKQDMDLKSWIKKETINTEEKLIPDILDFKDFKKFIEKRRSILKPILKKLLV